MLLFQALKVTLYQVLIISEYIEFHHFHDPLETILQYPLRSPVQAGIRSLDAVVYGGNGKPQLVFLNLVVDDFAHNLVDLRRTKKVLVGEIRSDEDS